MEKNDQSPSINKNIQQQHPGKQVDGPDPVIDEPQQPGKTNPQNKMDKDDKERAYKEGLQNNSDTESKDSTDEAKE